MKSFIIDDMSRQIAKEALEAEKDGIGWEDYAKYRGVSPHELEAMIGLYILETDDDEIVQIARLIISGAGEPTI